MFKFGMQIAYWSHVNVEVKLHCRRRRFFVDIVDGINSIWDFRFSLFCIIYLSSSLKIFLHEIYSLLLLPRPPLLPPSPVPIQCRFIQRFDVDLLNIEINSRLVTDRSFLNFIRRVFQLPDLNFRCDQMRLKRRFN